MNANEIAINIYCSGLKIEIIPRPEATIKESIATGPTDNCLDVPRIAYTI